MNKHLISVIIPAYNVEAYLARCLDSVCGQSYKDLEIIIIDDGSVDKTPEICDEYARRDGRIRVLHKKNAGVSAARNDALDLTSGDMIAFADADDYFEPDMIERLYAAITGYDADMAVCGYYEEYNDRVEERGRTDTVVFGNHEAYEDYFKMGGCIGSGCWNKLIRAAALKDIRYKAYAMGEDVEFLCRVLDNCDKVVCIGYRGYHYIHREDSATQTGFRPQNMDIIHVVDEMAEYIGINHPELIKQLYGFHAAWYVATLQVMKRSGSMNKHKREQMALRRGILDNMKNYSNNPYVYKVDKVLLKSFLLHIFVPVQSMYEVLSGLKHKMQQS